MNVVCLTFFVITSTVFGASSDSEIIVYNTANKPLYGIFYYAKHTPFFQHASDAHGALLPASELLAFAPSSKQTVQRPARKYHWTGWYDRFLYVSDDQQTVENFLRAPTTTDSLVRISVGAVEGCHFYLDDRNGTLHIYNALSWNLRMLHEALEAAFCFVIEEVRNEHGEHPHSNVQATIRAGEDLSTQEEQYLQARALHTQQATKKIVDETEPVRIALCGSGGGYRAMISMLGSLEGADEIGLLDATTYLAGVSGSTWAIAGFIQSGLSSADYTAACAEQIERNFIYDHDSDQVAFALLKQFAFTQNVSLIDFYGALLAQNILKAWCTNDPHEIDLASQTEKIANGKQLFPIYTSLMERTNEPYAWVEFTPYEVSCSCLGAAIPTWAFGRKFSGGSSCNFSPSQSLGFFMGIWSSALSANLKDLVHRYSERLCPGLIARLLQNLVQGLPSFSEGRISAAEVCNWTAGTTLPYAHLEKIRLLDAGFDCNVPLPPLLRTKRSIDIIIIADATYRCDDGSELLRAQLYAQQHQLPFPPINQEAIENSCSVHADWDNPEVPVIIYIPLRKQSGYQHGWDPYQQNFIGTFNFVYTREQMLLLSGLTRYTMILSKELIFDTIKRVIARNAQVRLDYTK